ncbi:MAG: antA/AntB antirepressor family protein [Dysgonamonadaceae bacterium]|jgi:phage anti-repressor protein|nr:antA/AntB antirepressor family protein [Dysgonamonadaceae bacterium]
MTTVKETTTNKQLILANDFFELIKTKEDFTEWLYRRISEFEMEFNADFCIFIDAEAAIEIAKYETFRDTEAKERLNKITGLKQIEQ